MAEHRLCKAGVRGSIPLVSTGCKKGPAASRCGALLLCQRVDSSPRDVIWNVKLRDQLAELVAGGKKLRCRLSTYGRSRPF